MALYVNESGPASAPTVVFLHGGGGAGWMWQPQLEAFADYHCLVPDLPEHGRSAEVKPFTIAGSAALPPIAKGFTSALFPCSGRSGTRQW